MYYTVIDYRKNFSYKNMPFYGFAKISYSKLQKCNFLNTSHKNLQVWHMAEKVK